MTLKPLFISALALLGLQACAPSAYNINSPEPSNISYHKTAQSKASTLHLKDKRTEVEKTFSYGVLKAELIENKAPIEPVSFLKTHAQAEFDARGIKSEFSDEGINIDLYKFVVRNHRTNGYTPFITFTMLSADIETEQGPERIGVFIKRGKTPVWSFNELIEPTLNQPLSLVVKEFVSKLNTHIFKHEMSDQEVKLLLQKIKQPIDEDLVYLDVYQLGFSNNKSALEPLLDMTSSDDEYIRLAAISGLGNLGYESSLDKLESIYQSANIWQDKAMALKSIGDIGTESAREFLQKAAAELAEASDKEQVWSGEIIDLYLK